MLVVHRRTGVEAELKVTLCAMGWLSRMLPPSFKVPVPPLPYPGRHIFSRTPVFAR